MTPFTTTSAFYLPVASRAELSVTANDDVSYSAMTIGGPSSKLGDIRQILEVRNDIGFSDKLLVLS